MVNPSSEETGLCSVATSRRRSRGVLAKGTESFATILEPCGKPSGEGTDLCPRHAAAAAKMAAKLAAKRAAETRNQTERKNR